MTRVWIDPGQRWTFASALDWPGWARRGRGEQAAIETLDAYTARYAAVAAGAGIRFDPDDPEIVGRGPADAIVDFGAPGRSGPLDHEPLTPGEAARQVALLQASWAALDAGAAAAPASLRKGPRGGGRDRDQIVEHVREAERAYARKIGVRLPPRTPWPDQRSAIAAALLAGVPAGTAWPPRYFLRRTAWHVTDHLWEIEDRSG